MATVIQLLDRACRITGMRTTGTEREIALEALQDAYRRVVIDAECSLDSVAYTVVSSDDSYSLSTILAEEPLRLYHVSVVADGVRRTVQQVSFQELLDERELGEVSGSPYLYAISGFDTIHLHPAPTVGSELTIWFVKDVLTLVEEAEIASEEESPSSVPAAFHWACLLPAVVLELLDKDQRATESSMWQQRYANGISRLIEHIGQFGGEANRAYLKKGMN